MKLVGILECNRLQIGMGVDGHKNVGGECEESAQNVEGDEVGKGRDQILNDLTDGRVTSVGGRCRDGVMIAPDIITKPRMPTL